MNWLRYILYITAGIFLVLVGVYLLMHSHLVAGGWTLAFGIIMLTSHKSSSDSDGD